MEGERDGLALRGLRSVSPKPETNSDGGLTPQPFQSVSVGVSLSRCSFLNRHHFNRLLSAWEGSTRPGMKLVSELKLDFCIHAENFY